MGNSSVHAVDNAYPNDPNDNTTAIQSAGFSRDDLLVLSAQFNRKYPNGYMTTEEFVRENQSIQGGTRDFWLDVARNFVSSEGDRIGFRDFIAGISSITSGTTQEKLEWMFKLYDHDGNGVLDRGEVQKLVKGVLRAQQDDTAKWDEASLKAKADKLFALMDSDGNGAVDLPEFVAVASKDDAICNALATQIAQSTKVESAREDFSTFDNQVAGHSTGNQAMLKDPEGKTIFKPMTQAEFDFYVHMQKAVDAPTRDAIFPHFYGRKVVTSTDASDAFYIVLEDLTYGFKKPNIMDLKMGFRGHDDNARTLKVVQQVALCTYTTSSSLGFRLCGMRYHGDSGSVVVRGKPWGAKLSRDTMIHALLEFVTQLGHVRYDVVTEFLRQLRTFTQWFTLQRLYKFYSSSILFVWDADAPVGSPKVRVRLVDFAHTFPNAENDSTLDTNFLSALNILVAMWETIAMGGRELYENQRLKQGVWSKDSLAKGDPHHHSSIDGKLPVHMQDPAQWCIDRHSEADADGWMYAASFRGPWTDKPEKSAAVRRRKWVRRAKSVVLN